MTRTHKTIIGTVTVVVFFLALPAYHVGQRFIHWITEPDKTICVQSHTDYIWQPGYMSSDGKSTYWHAGYMMPIYVCDKKAPTPKYVQQMEKWNASKP